MTFVIRRARTDEAEALTALTMASKQSVGYDDAFMAACADELQVTEDQIANSLYWIAESDTLLGCMRLEITENKGFVHTLFIHPDHKRKGVGRALWQVVLDTANSHNLTSVTLDAEPTAVPFYEALGLTVIGETPSGSIPGRMLPLMALKL